MEEEDPNALHERLGMLGRGCGWSDGDVDALLMRFVVQQGVQLLGGDRAINPALANAVAEVEPCLVVADPFRRLHTQDENQSAEMAVLMDQMRRLTSQLPHRFALLLAHHLRKPGKGAEDPMDRVRGSSDITASVDCLLNVRGEIGQQAIHHTKAKRGPKHSPFVILGEVAEEAARFGYCEAASRASQRQQDVSAFVLELLRDGPLNTTVIRAKAKEKGNGRTVVDTALAALADEGAIATEKGPRNATMYRLADPVSTASTQGALPAGDRDEVEP